MVKLVHCPVCRRPDLCVIACPNNKILDQFVLLECDVQPDEPTNDEEVLEIVFDVEDAHGDAPPAP